MRRRRIIKHAPSSGIIGAVAPRRTKATDSKYINETYNNYPTFNQ